MCDSTNEVGAVLFENRYEILMSLAFVQKHRLSDTRSHFKLLMKSFALHVAGREIAKVVETAFAYRNDFGFPGQFLESCQCLGCHFGGVVGMHSGGREE